MSSSSAERKMSGSPTAERGVAESLLTRTECEQVLENLLSVTHRHGKLVEYSIQPELENVGYLGEYFHLYLQYKTEEGDSENTRLFAKTVPYGNVNMCKHISEWGILRKEATLYQKLLSELRTLSESVWCARCYYSRDDLFVLENIVDLGYEVSTEPSGFLNQQQVHALLKSLAIIHASSIAYEVQRNVVIGELLRDVLYEVTISPEVVWYTAGMKAVLAVALEHPAYQVATIQDFIRTKLAAQLNSVYEMVNASPKYRNVFCHRDPWGGNVFFKTNSASAGAAADPAILVDYQLCRYSPPAIDVLMAVYMNVQPRQLKNMLEPCLRHYYEDFASALVAQHISPDAHMSLPQFRASVGEFKLQAVLYNCIAATVLRIPDNYMQDMKLNRPEDFFHFTNVDRTKEVLKLVQSSTQFRDYMFDCVENLLDLVLP